MKFKNQSIYNLFIVCIQCIILNCVGQNNHMEIYVDCNTLPYKNYKCGGTFSNNSNPPCESLEDAQQVSINLYDEWYNVNYKEFSLTIFISPCSYGYYQRTELSFFGYTTVEIKNKNGFFGKILIFVGSVGYDRSNQFLVIEDANEVIKISGLTFEIYGNNPDFYHVFISLSKYLVMKSRSIYLEYCIFDNLQVIFDSDYSYLNQFSLIGSNFKNIKPMVYKPIFKIINANFTMVNVNVTNCEFNELGPFIELFNVSGMTLSDITFQGNKMGSFLHVDHGGPLIANNLHFVNNIIKLFDLNYDGIDSKKEGKYIGFLNLFGFGQSFLNGFKFQNNTINSLNSSLNSIIQISECNSNGFENSFNVSYTNVSDTKPINVHFLDVKCSGVNHKEHNIVNITNSEILDRYLIGGYNFTLFIENTTVYQDFIIDCSECIYTFGSKKSKIPSPTSETHQTSTNSILIIIFLSIFGALLVIFLIFIWKNKKLRTEDQDKEYIYLDTLDAKPSNGDEDILLQDDEEGATCDSDASQSTPTIYYVDDEDIHHE